MCSRRPSGSSTNAQGPSSLATLRIRRTIRPTRGWCEATIRTQSVWPSERAASRCRLFGAGEGPVPAPDGHAAQRSLGRVVAHADPAVPEIAGQRLPVVEGVGDRLADLGLGRDPRVLGAQPRLELDRPAASPRSVRTARRSAAGLPLISRSIANSPSMRRTASAATGAFETAASSNSFLRACTIRTQSSDYGSRRPGPLPGGDLPGRDGLGGPPDIMSGGFRDEPRRRLVPCSTLGSVRRRPGRSAQSPSGPVTARDAWPRSTGVCSPRGATRPATPSRRSQPSRRPTAEGG